MSEKKNSAELLNDLFGGRLISSSSGFLTTLEFFGIVGGVHSYDRSILPHENESKLLKLRLGSADFARRYAWRPNGKDIGLRILQDEVFKDELADLNNKNHFPLKHLIRALAIPMKPGSNSERTWTTAYFYPFSKELMHWDVRRHRNNDEAVGVERNNMRGAGALVHKFLRTDNDLKRLERNRIHLKEILSPTLATDGLFEKLNSRNNADLENIFEDDIEAESSRCGLESEDLLCRAIDNVLSKEVDKFTKVNFLMHIIPLAVICHSLRVARRELNQNDNFVTGVVDFGNGPSQLRRESKSSLERAIKDCKLAIRSFIKNDNIDVEIIQEIEKKALGQRGWGNFYSLAAVEIGYLNAPSGNRHHVIKDSLLEALVAAELEEGESEITLEEFCKRLFTHWGMVIDKNSAKQIGLLNRMNGADFEVNSKQHFAKVLKRLGLLNEFSDQTLMVSLP